ncbi:MAG: FAD-dependent oxidoreductase [Candidatus Marinimicrobia bacterium]|nr:FAD-dependent oxidoreductase [Candidatus Neomarinimicrobiota bacterium]
MKIVVIGAGIFGSWTAFHLQKAGHHVTLIDRHGPGNPKASSGGESRMIRGIYGKGYQYIQWTARSLDLWRSCQESWDEVLYIKTGILWMFSDADDYARDALPVLDQLNLKVNELSKEVVAKRFSQINNSDVKSFFYEPDAGFLRASHACKVVVDQFVKLGGDYVEKYVEPPTPFHGELGKLKMEDGSTIRGDHYIFCCGPWMGAVFPEVIGGLIRSTRQEVFFFDTPPEFMCGQMPMWGHFGDGFRYGIPGSKYHGFKFANDERGFEFDPETGDRNPTTAGMEAAKEYVSFRFPGLKNVEIIDSRVCQYENTPDEHFIIDRHPETENVWLVAGGSGHGFKMGPALGEVVADLVTEQKPIDPFFALSRFYR